MPYKESEKEKEKVLVETVPDGAIDKEEFLIQIQDEIALSRSFTGQKRDLLRTNVMKYIDQTIDDEKIPMNTAYASINLDIAIEMMDTKNPIFTPRGLWDDEIAENLTDVAQFDYKEMGMDKVAYQVALDRRMTWVGIIAKTGWDEMGTHPTIGIKDPMAWLPDPFFDNTTDARFHYFEELIPKECLSEEYGFSEEAEEMGWTISPLLSQNQSARNRKTGYNNTPTDKTMVSVINGYSYFDEVLYMVTLSEDGSQMLRCVEVKPVFKKEKLEYVPMSAVVNTKWYSPKRGDPFGTSMLELIGPKQSALSQLINLRLINAKFSTLGQMYLYDINTVQNANEIARPSTNPKIIWVDGKNNPISQAVYPVPRNNILEDSFRVSQEIMEAMQMETGINNNQLWVQWDGTQTLGEVKKIQENANIRFGLTTLHQELADEQFWRDIWYRSYKEFFSKTDKKFIRIASSIDGTRVLELTQSDFLTFEDPQVIIESKKKFESERARIAASLDARLAVMEANPNSHKISLNYIRRKILKLQGMTRADVQVMCPYEPDEMDARNIVKLLNENDMKAATIRDINQDHMTYLVVFQSAMDTEAKQIAIEMRKQAYIQSGQGQAKDVWGWAANVATNQMVNASISQNATNNPNQ